MRIKLSMIAMLLVWCGLLWAGPAVVTLKEGETYQTLHSTQPTQTSGKRIEVIEFFMYHCPACHLLDPALSAWVDKQGNQIIFRRIPTPLQGLQDVEARLFLTLEEMGLEKSLHNKIMFTWHVTHNRLVTDEDNINWAVKNGIDKEKFLAVYYSPGIKNKLSALPKKMEAYQVESTPTLVVDGRYLTNMAMVSGAYPDIIPDKLPRLTLQVVDALIAKALSNQASVKKEGK